MPTLMVHPSLLAQSIGSTPAWTTRHTLKLATRRYENINFFSRHTDVCPSLLARSTRSSPAPAVLWGSRARASALVLPALPRWLCRFNSFTHSHVNFPGYRYIIRKALDMSCGPLKYNCTQHATTRSWPFHTSAHI